MENSFLEKPALVMNIDDFAQGLVFARSHSSNFAQRLVKRGIIGEINRQSVRKIKAETFNEVGTFTLKGLVSTFEELKNAGLPNHASVKKYISKCIVQTI